jgi:muramoyltetrapeptide carboxypeptidase
MGLVVRVSEHILDKTGFLAGPDRTRAEEMNRFFADPDIKAVICARGGYGALRILKHLDFSILAKNPKIILGFSDISALLCAVLRQSRIGVFHGPTVCQMGKMDFTSRIFIQDALMGDSPYLIEARDSIIFKAGKAQGPVLGGNLTTICHLLSTGYLPDFKGCVLLLEDVGEAPYRLDRMLTQLRMSGRLDHLAGIALGDFTRCGDPNEVYRVLGDRLGGLNIPVIAGFPVGHGPTNLTVPLGLVAVLDTETNTLSFPEIPTWNEKPDEGASMGKAFTEIV